MLDIILIIIIIYFIVVFFVFRLIIPHLGFSTQKLPDKLPERMLLKINELKARTNSPDKFLELVYDFIGNKYRSERFNTVIKFSYLFKSLDEVWQMNGYMPCTQSNFLLRIFLVKSGYFKNGDINRKHVFVNFVPHQYLQVKVGNKWVDVDVGEKQRGMPIGKHLKYFG